MKNKINVRLIGIALLAILATVAGITMIYYSLFQSQVRSDLVVSAKLLKDTHYFESVNIDTDEIDLSTDITELRVTWIDRDGTVLYDNDTTASTLGNHMGRPEIHEAFDSGVGESIRKSDTMNENTFYYAVLLDNGTVLRVATDAKSLWSVFMSAAPIIGLILLLIVAVCVALSQMLTKQLIRPIEMMAENLEDTDFTSPYRELDPFSERIRAQHADILSAAKARQDFTANVSHELKTPITAISGYAELIENQMVSEEQQIKFAGEIRKQSDRLVSLVNDIIRLSELDHKESMHDFTQVDLYEVAEERVELLRNNAREKNVKLTLSGGHCMVTSNRGLIIELLDNLIQNAIRYNVYNGSVDVRVEGGDINGDNRKAIVVSDTGIGIPPADQDRIFERFYRVDKSRSRETGGTGLGLAIVKHIVELHDGEIILQSEVGKGTTIRVNL